MVQGFFKSTGAFIATLVLMGAFVIGGAVLIGRSDSGQINVSATINESNQKMSADGTAQNEQVNAVPPAFQNMPNGGLVPQGSDAQAEQTTEQAPVAESTTTATITENISEQGQGDGTAASQEENVAQ